MRKTLGIIALLLPLLGVGQQPPGTIDIAKVYGIDQSHDHTLKDHGYTYATASAKFPRWAEFCKADGWTEAEFLSQYEAQCAHNDAVWSADTYLNFGAVYTRPGRVTQSRVEVIDPHGWYRCNYPWLTALGHYQGGGSNVFGKSVADSQAPKGSTPGTAIVIDHSTWISSHSAERICMKSSAWGLDYGQVGGIAYSEGCRIEGYRFVGGHSGPIDGAYWSTGLAMADMGEAGSVQHCMSEGHNGPGYCFVGGTPGLFQALSAFYNAGAGFEFRSTSGLHQSVAIGLSGGDNRGGLIAMTAATGGVNGGSISFLGCKAEARSVPQKLATLRGSFNVTFTGCWISAEGIQVAEVFDVDGRNPSGGQDWQLDVRGLKHTSNIGAYVTDRGNSKTYTSAGPWKPVSFTLNDAGMYGNTRAANTSTPPPTTDPPPVTPPTTGPTLSTVPAIPQGAEGAFPLSNAVDGSSSTYFLWPKSMAVGDELIIDLPAMQTVKGVTFAIAPGYTNSAPRKFSVWTAGTGSFTRRTPSTHVQGSYPTCSASFQGVSNVKRVKIRIEEGNGGNWLAVANITIQ